MSAQNNVGDFLTAVADSIRAAEGTEGQIPAQDFPERIGKLSLEPGEEEYVAVFLDWDGTVLGKFVLDEGDTLNISAVPTPSHDGMVFDHWMSGVNPSRIINGVLTMPDFDVVFGAIYKHVDSDSNEHDAYIDIRISESDSKTFSVNFATAPEYVNWGDGTTEAATASMSHTYANSGSYRVSVISAAAWNFASLSFGQTSSAYEKRVKGIHMSSLITNPTSSLSESTGWFAYCPCILRFSMEDGFGNGFASRNYYWYLFGPTGTTNEAIYILPESIGSSLPRYFFGALRGITCVYPFGCRGQDYPYTTVLMTPSFEYFTIPEGVSSFTSQFQSNYSIGKLRLTKCHGEMTSFPFPVTARSKFLRSASAVTQIGTQNESVHILAGGGFPTISSNNNVYKNLRKVSLPEGLSALTQYAFQHAYLLKKIEFPSTISLINNQCFHNCGCLYYDFRKATIVPTLSATGIFLNSYGLIVVPDALYDTWIATTNWVTYAQLIIKASDFDESEYQ